MSKRKRKPKSHSLLLEKGHFYNVHDRSKKGHPGRIEKIDLENDIYLSVTTGSMTKEEYNQKPFRKDYEELEQATSKDVFKSFIHKRPFIGTRDDYGDTKYETMEFDEVDLPKVKKVLKRTPRKGYWYKKKKPS